MDQKNYTKMRDNNNDVVMIPNDRVNKFLGEGWQLLSAPEKAQGNMKLTLTVDAQVTKPKKSKRKKKTEPTTDYIDEVKYDMDADEGEDILLPEDLTHVCNEDCTHDTKEN